MKAAKRRFGLPYLATEDVSDFDTSEHATYTEEEPNALSPEEVPSFLERMRELYPQHYAMTFLGLITGLRPSTLRPLRRNGPEPDVRWEESRILVRRSQTLGDEVMQTTKTKRRYAIHVPKEVMEVLRWHVDTQLVTPEMQESDLLFPSVTGRFRAPSVLNKPFEDVMQSLGFRKQFTQRGLRRTFNDLARVAQVEAVVTRSISGHATERMQEHYSTVNGAEQQAALARVVKLFTAVPGGEHGGERPSKSGEHTKKAG
jgi:integrase